MQEVSISTIDEYVKAVSNIRKTFHKEYPLVNEVPLFRGQADVSYELLPSIARGRHSETDITILMKNEICWKWQNISCLQFLPMT